MAEKRTIILGLESSCDETAAAIVADGREVLSSVVASQANLHEQYGGVVPEIAARAHIENILPVLLETFKQAGVSSEKIDAVAVANCPGLTPALLIAVTAAKTLAWAWQKPLIAINHIHSHLQAVMLEQSQDCFPAVALVVSGGHTSIYRCESPLTLELMGRTIDDARPCRVELRSGGAEAAGEHRGQREGQDDDAPLAALGLSERGRHSHSVRGDDR